MLLQHSNFEQVMFKKIYVIFIELYTIEKKIRFKCLTDLNIFNMKACGCKNEETR